MDKTTELAWLVDKFTNRPSYFKVGNGQIAKVFDVDIKLVGKAKEIVRGNNAKLTTQKNVLVISDTHIPAVHKDALQALQKAYNEYNITDVIHIGDIIDLHTVSYHETSQDAPGVNTEIELVKADLKEWYDAFPEMTIMLGNHDRLIDRKAQTSKIPEQFIKGLNDVLEVPTWSFVDSLTIGKVFFTHGIGMSAERRAQLIGKSVVQGHHHSKKYIKYVDVSHDVFGMQVGCLIDKETYNMEYAKHSVIALGFAVILDVENTPIPILLNV